MRRLSGKAWIIIALVLLLGSVSVVPAWAADRPLAAEARDGQGASDWRCVVINGQVGLNVRTGPGTAYPVVDTRQPGEQIEADFSTSQTSGGYEWLMVRYPGGDGWVIAPRLDPCAIEATVPPATQLPADDQPATHEAVPVVNDDGTLDRFEIAALARSVVLVANIRRNRVVATGTGTITTSDGLILTNAHVVEGADQIAVAVLTDLNDPPEFQFLGEVLNADMDIDAALVAITTDLDGVALSPSSLNLPYVPVTLAADEVYRGDAVYIFGYPGIGDDFLVVTTGTIVSVENGTMNGRRMPVWYRTDAEIAPGNSGGLVVNGNGEFVGIPTFVQTEEQTGGRLAGIRPAEVALMAVIDEGLPTVSDSGASPPAGSAVAIAYQDVWLEHGVPVEGETGLALHVAFSLSGWQEQEARVVARFFHDDQISTPLLNPTAPGHYRDKAGQVLTSVPIVPCCAETIYTDLPLSIPYTALGIEEPGTYPLKIQVEVVAGDDSWRRTLSWEFIAYTLR